MMMAMVAIVPVGAAANDIETPGGSGTTRVELTYGTDTNNDNVVDHGANFKVTVPTVIPFTVDSDGNVTTASDLKIVNHSKGPVDITAVHADTVNGWQIVTYGTDFRNVPVDSKQFTFQLNGDNFAAGTSVDLTLGSAWKTINGETNMALPYNGDFAVQSEAINAGHIANVIFTAAWHTAS